jgi:putative membrane protein
MRIPVINWLLNQFPEKEVKKFFIIFYCIGCIGLLLSITQPYFKILTPFALLINSFYLFIFHESKWNSKTIIIFALIFSTGILIEIVGVNTGIIFGEYSYGNSLGFKLFNTPLIIGINWLFLIYSCSSIAQEFFTKNKAFQVLFGATLMVAYDLILEQVAPKMDMWYWITDTAPMINYISWFLVSVLFLSLISFYKINTRNKLAFILFLLQFLFFIVLFLFL